MISSNSLRIVALFLLVFSVPIYSFGGAEERQQIVQLDTTTRLATPAGALRLRPQDLVIFRILNTNSSCYDFNFETIKESEEEKKESARLKFPHDEIVTISTRHERKVVSYRISMTRKAGADAECNRSYTWEIPVITDGWSLGFAGAFTIDGLTDPVFFLEEGSLDAGTDSEREGFFLRSQEAAEDSYKLSVAGMINLFDSDEERWKFAGGNWVPISFGLGINDGSEVRYFLGTGLRFSQHLFVSVGAVFGSRDRPPNDLVIGGFTTEANKLDNLPTKTDASAFIAISYSFLNPGESLFKGRFKQPKGAVSEPTVRPSSAEVTPTVGFAKESIRVKEGEEEVRVGLTRKGGAGAIAVTVSVSGESTAIETEDFEFMKIVDESVWKSPLKIDWSEGLTAGKEFLFRAKADQEVEEVENVILSLKPGEGVSLGQNKTLTIQIESVSPPPPVPEEPEEPGHGEPGHEQSR